MLYLINSSIIPEGFEGIVRVRKVSVPEANRLIAEAGDFQSAIGHSGTAAVLSRVLNREIKTSRRTLNVVPGDEFLAFQLKTRLPEGAVLSEAQLTEIVEGGGFSFKLLSFG